MISFIFEASLLFMRSTFYCHCMEGYTCPYLELVYQCTTFKTEQSRCQQTVTTSIKSKVCDMIVDYFILTKTFMLTWSCVSLVNHMSPTGLLCYQNLTPVAEWKQNHKSVMRSRSQDFFKCTSHNALKKENELQFPLYFL